MEASSYSKEKKFTITDTCGEGSKSGIHLVRQMLDNLGEPTEFSVWFDEYFPVDSENMINRVQFVFKSMESCTEMWDVLRKAFATNDVQTICTEM